MARLFACEALHTPSLIAQITLLVKKNSRGHDEFSYVASKFQEEEIIRQLENRVLRYTPNDVF